MSPIGSKKKKNKKKTKQVQYFKFSVYNKSYKIIWNNNYL